MTATQETLKQTPLYNEHVALNARIVPFGGWEMPVQYEGILAEYEHTRKAVTLFDTCHMGEFLVHGGCRESGLDQIVTMSIADMPLKSCRYGMMLNDQGGVIDDLIVFREEKEKWFIVVNGATTAKDARHLRERLRQPEAFEDISASIGKIDVQGPLSREVLEKYAPGIGKLAYYTFDQFNLLGERVLISRTGYTGELGYEIYSSARTVGAIWRELLKNKEVNPAGLGARDVLRLEAGYSLYGHELNEDITPLEAGLDKSVDFTKDFIGKDALLTQRKEGLRRKITGFISDTRRAPRQDQRIYSRTGEAVGTVTSGTFSPFCQKGIGLGFVPLTCAQKGVTIYFAEDKNAAKITGKIFYQNDSLKKTTA
ncbi:MAG: glycine cleavage system aminomethyltransferase GcvT [Candidatus Omnitrophica bacterium]|nr:glycine cleavage system aminomethyltransferase GcvT [Candidatus Omnitrophota bacterium]